MTAEGVRIGTEAAARVSRTDDFQKKINAFADAIGHLSRIRHEVNSLIRAGQENWDDGNRATWARLRSAADGHGIALTADFGEYGQRVDECRETASGGTR